MAVIQGACSAEKIKILFAAFVRQQEPFASVNTTGNEREYLRTCDSKSSIVCIIE